MGRIQKSKLWSNQASIGMFTNEKYRQRGFGTQTIYYIRKVCHQKNLIPTDSCWYYNHISKKTLEAAGMFVSSRLLIIEMLDAKYEKNP